MRLSYTLSTQSGSEQSRALILAESLAKPFESCRLSAYWDVAGYPTNGWGNLLSRTRLQNVMRDNRWTIEQANRWLHETWPDITQEEADSKLELNLDKAFKAVTRLVKVSLHNEQIAALIDFTFNLGAGNLQISTLLKLINRNELIAAGNEFEKWNKAGGIVSRGLTRRRLFEKQLFLSVLK